MRPIIARVFASAIAIAWMSSSPAFAEDKVDPLAPTGRWSANQDGQAALPPMGWNSWNAFNSDVDEEKVMASAKLIVEKGLREAGYRYINIDDGWWLRRRQPDGRMVIRADKFPSAAAGPNQQTSFRPLTDRLHAMGFKAGIYSDIGRNSCGQVYTPNFANQPEGTIAEREVGLYGHIDQDIALYFGEWGFDYIKVDGCGIRGLGKDSDHVRKGDYRELAPLIDMNSLARTNIPAVRALYDHVAIALKRENPDGDYLFSLCLWGSSDVRSWGKQVGNVSRTSDDITAHWSRMLTNLDTSASRALYAHPHTWNDPDMLFIGSGEFDANHMTEARSHFAMWAMMNAPLLIGFDLRKANAEQLALLGNRAIIALNQDAGANQAVPAYLSNDVQIFVKSLANGDKAVAILNRTAAPVQPVLTADHLKLRGEVTLTDLWTGAKSRFSGETKLTLAPHQTLIYRVTGTHRLADGHYLSEAPSDVNPAEDGIATPEGDPTIHHELSPWGGSKGPGDFPQYAGWGGAQADRTPFGRPLRLRGKVYDTGIGVLANSRLEVRNRGQARFNAMVGIDDSATARGRRVVFEVYGDGKLLTRSRAVALNDAPVAVEVDVRGRKLVELVARADSAPEAALPVVWADARLTG